MNRGLSLAALKSQFGDAAIDGYNAVIDELVQDGLLDREDDRLRLTAHGRLLSNEVFVRFLRAKNGCDQRRTFRRDSLCLRKLFQNRWVGFGRVERRFSWIIHLQSTIACFEGARLQRAIRRVETRASAPEATRIFLARAKYLKVAKATSVTVLSAARLKRLLKKSKKQIPSRAGARSG